MLEERLQIFTSIHNFLIWDTSREPESSPRKHVTLAEVNLNKSNDETACRVTFVLSERKRRGDKHCRRYNDQAYEN